MLQRRSGAVDPARSSWLQCILALPYLYIIAKSPGYFYPGDFFNLIFCGHSFWFLHPIILMV